MRALRSLGLLLALLAALTTAGCLRRRFNLCAEDPPHPDCPSDAGVDASSDAGGPADDAASAADDAAADAT